MAHHHQLMSRSWRYWNVDSSRGADNARRKIERIPVSRLPEPTVSRSERPASIHIRHPSPRISRHPHVSIARIPRPSAIHIGVPGSVHKEGLPSHAIARYRHEVAVIIEIAHAVGIGRVHGV